MDYKQEAEKIVEMFREFVLGVEGSRSETFNATQCAIKHVEGIMAELDIYDTKDYSEHCVERIQHYDNILNQLKQM